MKTFNYYMGHPNESFKDKRKHNVKTNLSLGSLYNDSWKDIQKIKKLTLIAMSCKDNRKTKT